MWFFFQMFSLLAILWPKKNAHKHAFERISYCNNHFNKNCFLKKKKKECPRTTISINDKCAPSHLAKYKHIWISDLFFLNALKLPWLRFGTQQITASYVPWTTLPSSSLSEVGIHRVPVISADNYASGKPLAGNHSATEGNSLRCGERVCNFLAR